MGISIQFGFYMLLLLGIGYYSMRKTRNNQDFIIGSRSLGPITSAISAGASDMSSWLLLGLPGAVFAAGLVEGFWISSYFNRLRKLWAVQLWSMFIKIFQGRFCQFKNG